MVKNLKAERVIFDNELKSIQMYNLAKLTGVQIIDRFQLILEIFTKNARTTEAHFQIKLAKLRYDLAQAKERVRKVFSCEQYIENFERVFDEIGSKKKRDDALAKELTVTILALVEAAAANKAKVLEQQQKLKELEMFYERVRNYPFYKVYHWLKYLV